MLRVMHTLILRQAQLLKAKSDDFADNQWHNARALHLAGATAECSKYIMATSKSSADNPILNGPYDEPTRHYATDAHGNLNYRDIREGRRIFAPDTPQIPIGNQRQGDIFDLNDLRADYGENLVNQVREQVRDWRNNAYQGVTSRVTRDLLNYWFLDTSRQNHQKLFFAQREAVETAIWLNEQADKSNHGTHLLNLLTQANQSVSDDSSDRLPRQAFKMATGTGKTVVMACLILYHYLNRREYRNDIRYADYFLVVAPGITIRDRLNVLFPDPNSDNPHQAQDYYRTRYLVPPAYRDAIGELGYRLVVTNFHEFLPRALSGNKRSPFDGKLNADGQKQTAYEDMTQVLRRVLGSFKPGRRLLVLNDEAHHCYLPKAKGKNTEQENAETENERAAVWFSGLRACAGRFKLRAVYDLSATPYYLAGSGYSPYAIFPWVITDFGLIDAIEAGLVKIPFLPVDDTSHAIDEPKLKNLYEHSKDLLPKRSQRHLRKQEQAAGQLQEAPPELPALVKTALDAFYRHYEEYDAGMRRSGEQRADMFTEPPVFIVVCSNTAVSREVFKEIAGYQTEDENGAPSVIPGRLPLFSNFDPATGRALSRPPTLLIDSDALEHSGQMDDSFKKVFAPEIERFKREYRLRHPDRSIDALSDADLLREVVNTVGKRDALGSHIRCVVSVSMLTEGWDANTVTHVMGLRAFGSQLLCEQVAGRALRRRSYHIDPKTGRFPPEYAHIIGVPFKLFKAGQSSYVEPPEYSLLRALPDRDDLEIRFPLLTGYRLETDSDTLDADFSGTPNYRLDCNAIPLETRLGSAFSGDGDSLVVPFEELRDQQVIFRIVTEYLKRQHQRNERHDLRLFAQVRRIVEIWYRDKVELVGETDPGFKRLLHYLPPQPIVESIALGVIAHAAQHSRVLPIFNHYNPQGSTCNVFGQTAKPVFATRKSHVNLVVADTDTWEQIAAKTLEQMREVESYVKNAFLGFSVPYSAEGKERQYLPDYLLRIKSPASGRQANVILEITGFNQDKEIKRWYVNQRWLPAINASRDKLGLAPWYFLEVTDIDNIKPQLKREIQRIIDELDEDQDLMHAQSLSLTQLWNNPDDDIWNDY